MADDRERGVLSPKASDGRRSTAATGRTVWAEAVRGVDAELAMRIGSSRDWRKEYVGAVVQHTAAATRSPDVVTGAGTVTGAVPGSAGMTGALPGAAGAAGALPGSGAGLGSGAMAAAGNTSGTPTSIGGTSTGARDLRCRDVRRLGRRSANVRRPGGRCGDRRRERCARDAADDRLRARRAGPRWRHAAGAGGAAVRAGSRKD